MFAERCAKVGLRVEVTEPDRGTLAARIRAHRLVPYQAVIGAREAGGGTVSLRLRSGNRLDLAPIDDALDRITSTVNRRDHTL